MLLFLIVSALSTPITAELKAASTVAEHFATTKQPINTGCDTDPVANQLGMTGWKPSCSHGTLTEVSAWLVMNGSMEIQIRSNDHATGATRRIIEKERKRFSNPKTVLRTYATLKPVALLALQQSSPKHTEEIRAYINTTLIPELVYDVPPSLRELWVVEATAYKAMMLAPRVYSGTFYEWDPEARAAYKAANLAFGNAVITAGYKDPMALQWRYRREEEGGQPLVAAYLQIFNDFARSI